MLFCQPLQPQFSHHSSTKAYLCSPLFSIPFSTTAWVTICSSTALWKTYTVVTTAISEVFNMLTLHSVKHLITLKMKCNHLFAFHCDSSIMGARAEYFALPYGGKKRDFSCFLLSITLCNKASILAYKAFWHINFYQSMGVVPTKIKFVVILFFFEVALVSTPILKLLPKKVNKQVWGEMCNFINRKHQGHI